MRDNLDKMVKRGDQLEQLDQASIQLEADASSFKIKAIQVRKVVWWRRVRLWVIAGFCLALIVFIMSALFVPIRLIIFYLWYSSVVIVCGGFTFPNCGGGASPSSPPPPPAITPS